MRIDLKTIESVNGSPERKTVPRIGILDYGMGNLGSIGNMVKHVGGKPVVIREISSDVDVVGFILPGVGAFDRGMKRLKQAGMDEALRSEVLEKHRPLLGICLGMQLLLEGSEEGQEPGLGLVKGYCRRFRFEREKALKVPHMGWNEVYFENHSRLKDGLNEPETRFYFVHSYRMTGGDASDVTCFANYGERFACGFEHHNIFGVQFHPEKSHRFGKALMENFVHNIC